MPLKQCSKCREFKSLEYFSKDKTKKNGRSYQCKRCRKEYGKRYREEHKEKMLKKAKKYYKEHKEERKEYREEHKEERKKYQEKHKEEKKLYDQKYKEKRNKRSRIRRKTDFTFRLNDLIGRAIRQIKNPSIKKGQCWIKLLPYTLIELKKHLKNTLPGGYSWNDFMQGKLHIDHILPIAIFKYEKAEDLAFQICWGLDNLRLLPAKENMRKKARLITPFQKTFAMEVKLRDKCVSSI